MAQIFDLPGARRVPIRDGRIRTGLRNRLDSVLHRRATGRILLLLILLAGAYLRWSNLDWDQGTHIHPDERFLVLVEDALKLPQNIGQYFNSPESPLNPHNDKRFPLFVYGTLPIIAVRYTAAFLDQLNQQFRVVMNPPNVPLSLTSYWGVYLVGRAMSGLFDLGCVWLIYLVGARLYRRRVGLLAALLLAFAPLAIQQSHFFTVDTFGTFFALLTTYFAIRVVQGSDSRRRGRGLGWYVLLGASLGAAISCRINLAPLAGIALLAAGIRAWNDWRAEAGQIRQAESLQARGGNPEDESGAELPWLGTFVQATLFRVLMLGVVAFFVFRVAQPYAFGGTTFFDFTLSRKWLENMRYIQELISGEIDQPPGHQWASRTPFVFPLVNMVVWGLGLPLGLAGWAGWAVAALQLVRGRRREHILPVVWIGGMFLWQGLQWVQSMRYLLPIYPHLALMAAWLAFWLIERAGAYRTAHGIARAPANRFQRLYAGLGRAAAFAVRWRLAYALVAFLAIGTVLWGLAFHAIYRRPLSRITASRWIYQNIPPGSALANEHWDDTLPLQIDGRSSFRPVGPYRGLSSSSSGLMNLYDEDSAAKRELMYRWLSEADYIVITSNRLYDSIPRLPMRYPLTTRYYELLFAGKLGFDLVHEETSFPSLFGITFDDRRAEEAWSVYDHPVVLIFQKTPAYSESLVRSQLDLVDVENTIQMWPKQVSDAPTALLMGEEEAARQRAGGTWSELFDPDGLANRIPVLVWLLLLEILGLIALPYLVRLLPGLADRGYGFAKLFGILALAWLSWLGPSLKILPYSRWAIAACLLLLAAGGGWLAWRGRAEWREVWRKRRRLWLLQEGLFLALFLVFLAIRWANPDLWHPARGGEKPMDFAFLNAVIRSTTFPPYDPWFAGGFINYYYFGFVIVGTLIKLAGIVPAVAYNLAVPTLFALTGLGAFTVAFNLAAGEHEITWSFPPEGRAGSLPRGALFAGLAGMLLVAVVGNLAQVELLSEQWAARSPDAFQSTIPGLGALVRAAEALVASLRQSNVLQFPNDWWFWNASRVIPETINEFPFFTFVYADLHAHMIALPLGLAALGVAIALARGAYTQEPGSEPPPWRIERGEVLLLGLFGWLAGALRATNTWDYPTYLLVAAAAVLVREGLRRARWGVPYEPELLLPFLFRGAVAVIWRLVILFAVAAVTFYPYTSHYATAYGGLEHWTGSTTSVSDYLTVWGVFLAIVAVYLFSEMWAQSQAEATPGWLASNLFVVILAAVMVMAAAALLNAPAWLAAAPPLLLALVLAMGHDVPPARRLALLLIALALAITMGVEIVRLKDDIGRMNTVFKFYLQAWVLLGVAGGFALTLFLARSIFWPSIVRRALNVLLFVFVAAALLYPPSAARAKIADRFSADARPQGLDGTAYMEKAHYVDNNRDMQMADDKAAMEWMLANVRGSPVILEGLTPGYRWGNRYSVYTGLPAVMGWDWHERQQRSVIPQAALDRRTNHVKEMYSSLDLGRVKKLLDLYRVSYIVVGELERSYYPPAGIAKFQQLAADGYLRLAYSEGTVFIYEVVERAQRLPANG